jgi:hypothetical protein
MALSRVTDWSDGQVLTSSALEAEFDNIYNNGRSLINPMTGDLDFNGNDISGVSLGSVSAPSISFTGDSNTGIYSSGADSIDLAVGGVQGFRVFLSSSRTLASLTSTEAGSSGPVLQLYHNSASPADSDVTGLIDFFANDDGATQRIIASIRTVFEDVTSTTMDSSFQFLVMNAVNAGNAATVATLSSLGAWTDASAAAGKEYIGDVVGSMIDKAKQLTTLGIYRGKGTPAEKHATAEVHYSPTAEEFYEVFGLGIHPSRAQHPGIAPKDVAWLAVKMALELDARLAALEAA